MALEPITRQEKIIAGQDLTPITRMEKFLKDFGGGGGGVQPDWNQNDSTAADYVKNRPFYIVYEKTVVVEENTISFADTGNLYIAGFSSAFLPTVGESYTVSWDETVYECTCTSFMDMKVIGNLFLASGPSPDTSDTGEPFVMMFNGEQIQIGTLDTSASHTFSISQCVAGEVVKIDEKFIPDVSGLIVKSSTADSTKKFRITVNDSGTISATEVT